MSKKNNAEKAKKLQHTMEHEKEYKDWLISNSDKAIEWIEKNRKVVQIGLAAFFAILIIGGIVIYFAGSSNREASTVYYKANKDIMKEVQDAQSTSLKGGKLTDDEVNRLKERYDDLMDNSSTYGNLAKFNQGVIYYSVGNYGEAALYFKKASELQDFPLNFLAKLNLAHNYFNLAYMDVKENKLDKAIENYQQAISFYDEVIRDFKDSPVTPIAYKSKGLALEYLAKAFIIKENKELAKENLTKSKESYEKLLPMFKEENDIKQALEDDTKVAIRRVEIQIEELAN